MLIIASRESRLALWQAQYVQKILTNLVNTEVQILGMTTKGDRILDTTLSKIGGKGLFIKELETALLGKKANLAVHSLKDVPMELDEKFLLGSILKREDPRDAFVSIQYDNLDELPNGSVVGTSSLRREFQLKRKWPGLKVVPLRGNLDTRLKKLETGDMKGIILAAAGLIRLNYEKKIKQLISSDDMLPATGQGALGIEILAKDNYVHDLIQPLTDLNTKREVLIERAVSRNLGASCQLPLAVFCEYDSNTQKYRLRARLAFADATNYCSVDITGDDSHTLVSEATNSLISQGAKQVIDSLTK